MLRANMRRALWTSCAAAIVALATAAPTAASGPSCVAQIATFVAHTGPGAVGAAVSFEARNPEVLGVDRFGEFVSFFARQPHEACPFE